MEKKDISQDNTTLQFLAPSKNHQERLTPMMEQYIEIKAIHDDFLLFYRMGDFYELFFDDAIKASQALGITLTTRGKHLGNDIPMCGVPVHSADDYLQKLISCGYRVAVCEQTEDPGEAKKRGSKSIVQREVVRLITPGTVTEDKLLDPARANYLMALSRIKIDDREEFAISWIDISTGIFRVAESNIEKLLTDIMRIDPQEIIVADSLFYDKSLKSFFNVLSHTISPQPAILFDTTTAERDICSYFKLSTLEGISDYSRTELSVIAATIRYIEKTQISHRPPLMHPERQNENSTLFIDAATRLNLELIRTTSGQRDGSLLKAIDRTVTGSGSRLLADRLISPLTVPEIINKRLDSITFFLRNTSLSETIRLVLKGGPDMPRALSRLALNRGGPRDIATIQRGFEIISELNQLFGNELLPQEISDVREIFSNLPTTLHARLDQALADNLPLLKRDGGFIRSNYHQELDEMRRLRDESRRVIAELQAQYVRETSIKTLKIKHNNILGYFIEVTASQANFFTNDPQIKARFIHRQTMVNAMRFTTTELAELESRITHATHHATTLELEIFDMLVSEITEQANFIRKAAEALAILDVSVSLAFLAEEQNYCRPIIDHSLTFRITAGRHPVVEQALQKQMANQFVANDCDLSSKQNHQYAAIWLLTGPNMGGKSTFLRQNALIAIMAQMGSFVPAISAHIGIVDRLFSRVGASDNLARGRSTFMMEMVETATILNHATSHSLVILDEIGRGTSTFDGLSIAWATVEYLHEVNQCRTILATHFHEMTALTEKLDHLYNVTMKVKNWNDGVIFLHEITQGAADRSYGVQVAKIAGLPKKVILRATNILHQLEQNKTAKKDHQLIDDLPLFTSQISTSSHETENKHDAIKEALKNINPDELSPKDALETLYRLKQLEKK
ncbi:DNA mismatch repair protein MutS [Bartonella ancashensis]|uniref:DNA mismatch repair protein MutS n=1 Tax=Bartonella ancashensis TaxID=1318743 RepID=A0A0M4LJA3_9HYPH|nr:DNA mismatch repair protein MutS [Bartonella ancashensis]ALE03352.1 DNA mismatch repair protein MutS [Bartonella ancashensis]